MRQTLLTAAAAAALLAAPALAQQAGTTPQQDSSSSRPAVTTGSADNDDSDQRGAQATSRGVAEAAGSAPGTVDRNNPTGDPRSNAIAGSTANGSNMQPTFSGSTDIGGAGSASSTMSGSTASGSSMSMGGDMSAGSTSAGTRAYSATSGGDRFGGAQVIANAPIPDTAETRRMYRPLSNAGRRTATGEGPVG